MSCLRSAKIAEDWFLAEFATSSESFVQWFVAIMSRIPAFADSVSRQPRRLRRLASSCSTESVRHSTAPGIGVRRVGRQSKANGCAFYSFRLVELESFA